MKKIMTFAVCGILLLTSCVKGFDEVAPEPTPTPSPEPTQRIGTLDNFVEAFND